MLFHIKHNAGFAHAIGEVGLIKWPGIAMTSEVKRKKHLISTQVLFKADYRVWGMGVPTKTMRLPTERVDMFHRC